MVEKYSTEHAKRKSANAARSRKSAPDGKKMHKHRAGPRCFLNIAYKWSMVDEGLDEPPSYTVLARKNHMGKDGSFLDERTEELVLEVEEAVEEMLQDGSPRGDSQTYSTAASNAKCYLLNQEYIKRGKTKKGTIYGLGSVQYKNSSPSVPIPVSLQCNLDVDMRMSGFETTIPEVKEDIAGVKEDFSALKAEINAFKTESTAPPQHLTINNPSELDRWCQELVLYEYRVPGYNHGRRSRFTRESPYLKSREWRVEKLSPQDLSSVDSF
uniref:Uncharacterized protein n=1 Tax=Brassica oleracea var. oleracea TaxID=109376 RepID=A0A0D3ATN1_BRAOL